MLTSAYDELQKNQSSTLRGELVTATAFLSAAKDGGAARDWGAGEQKKAYAKVTAAAAFNPGTSATFEIYGCTDKDGTSPVLLASSGAILTAALGAGAFIQMGYLKSGVSKQFLVGKVTVAGGNATTGAIVMGLIDKNAGQQSYGDLTNSI